MSSNLSSNKEVVHEILDLFRIYKDGTIERLKGYEIVPPSIDPHTGVQSKDVIISPETGLSARLYLPKPATNPSQSHDKLPLLFYFHGGGFCIESAFSPLYHNYLNSLVSAANIVAVSVNYRRSPEHPLPIPFDDSWAAVNWAVGGGDHWVNDFADLNRVFFAGDSAGGNIAYNLGMRVGLEGLSGSKLEGVILVQPWFGGEELIGSEAENPDFVLMTRTVWRIVWPSVTGFDDPIINPNKDPKIADMGCERMLVCVAEKDPVRDRGCHYYEGLRRSGWKGTADIVESAGEDHVFHLFNPTSANAIALLNIFVSFFN
ncbi:probable carboxylesterase 2 [Impatiens glandulifera]|uniref:probable carboxylesterase 2 n=1 Tax=Impatiens glandulifera TaxID=253017 RepID=UPI001FB0902D|nr:probable carboxylesterase 2 [Impatiens glandulifera]